MKAFKITKRSRRQSVFIIGPPLTSFPKPNLPKVFFSTIHRPTLFKPQLTFEVVVEQRPEKPVVVVPALDLEQPEMLDFVAVRLQAGFQRLSGTVEMPAEVSGL